MSQRKVVRKFKKEIDTLHEETRELSHEMFEQWLEVLELSPPFRISMELSSHGATTSHRAGIDLVLQTAFEQAKDLKRASAEEAMPTLAKQLSKVWETEAKNKGRELNLTTSVFFWAAAEHFTWQWLDQKLGTSQPGLTSTPAETLTKLKSPSKA